MIDDEVKDEEERTDGDTPLNISDDDLPEDEMPPVEEAEDGVLVGEEDEDGVDFEAHDDVIDS
jgi:hypothetical protein